MQVISIILAIIGLLAATAIYGCCEEKVRESRGEEFLAFYHEEMQRITLPDDADIGLHVPGDLLRYSEEYLPLLHSKWEQILGEYAAVSRNVALMELKRKRLTQLNELSKQKIDCSHSVFFTKWNSEQQARLRALKKTHGEILSAVEKYYAEAQLRNLDSDADVTRQISGLIRGANAVLRQSGAPEEALSEEAPAEQTPLAEKEEKPVPAAGEKQRVNKTNPESLITRLEQQETAAPGSEPMRRKLLMLLEQIRRGAGVDVTLPETKGNNALHYACAIGDMEVAEWLLKNGANPRAKTDKGYSPMWCIGTTNREALVQLLQRYISRSPREESPSDSAPESEPAQTAGRSAEAPRQRSGTVYVPEISFPADADFAEGLDRQYGRNGRRKNMQKAAACYKRAAEAGHAAAQNNLGHLYHQGWGVNKDLSRAAYWYKRSAEQGHAYGQSNYGTCLEFGWGVCANKEEAIEWYRKAARQGHPSAQKHLRRLGETP